MERMKVTAPGDTGLRAQWFGVTTLLIRDADTTILIDGFFSRPSIDKAALTRLARNEGRIKDALPRDKVPKIDAVLVSHSHYDHALDAPYVARNWNAVLVGSESTLNIARAEGMRPDSLRQVTHGSRFRLGQFEIEVFRTPHVATPLRGAIDESFEEPARVFDYKLGASFSFLLRHPDGDILVVPSAGSRENMFEGVHADVVFLGIATLGRRKPRETHELWAEAVRRTDARLVIPVHWDNFTEPFDAHLPPLPWPIDDVDNTLQTLVRLANELACQPRQAGVTIRLMPLKEPVSLRRPSRPPPPVPSCSRSAAPSRSG